MPQFYPTDLGQLLLGPLASFLERQHFTMLQASQAADADKRHQDFQREMFGLRDKSAREAAAAKLAWEQRQAGVKYEQDAWNARLGMADKTAGNPDAAGLYGAVGDYPPNPFLPVGGGLSSRYAMLSAPPMAGSPSQGVPLPRQAATNPAGGLTPEQEGYASRLEQMSGLTPDQIPLEQGGRAFPLPEREPTLPGAEQAAYYDRMAAGVSPFAGGATTIPVPEGRQPQPALPTPGAEAAKSNYLALTAGRDTLPLDEGPAPQARGAGYDFAPSEGLDLGADRPPAGPLPERPLSFTDRLAQQAAGMGEMKRLDEGNKMLVGKEGYTDAAYPAYLHRKELSADDLAARGKKLEQTKGRRAAAGGTHISIGNMSPKLVEDLATADPKLVSAMNIAGVPEWAKPQVGQALHDYYTQRGKEKEAKTATDAALLSARMMVRFSADRVRQIDQTYNTLPLAMKYKPDTVATYQRERQAAQQDYDGAYQRAIQLDSANQQAVLPGLQGAGGGEVAAPAPAPAGKPQASNAGHEENLRRVREALAKHPGNPTLTRALDLPPDALAASIANWKKQGVM